jgi:hypothetical protein
VKLDDAIASFDSVVGVDSDVFGHLKHIGRLAGDCTGGD